MALEGVSGFSKIFRNQNPNFQSNSFQDEIMKKCSNFTNPMMLAVPPYDNPVVNLNRFQEHGRADNIQIRFNHGTTTLGFVFQGGIILAVDSRATGGAYIGSQTVDKVVKISDTMLGTLAGGAADCIYWDRVLTMKCRLFELRNKEPMSVAGASKIMANTAHMYSHSGLSMGMMLAGFDKRGSNLYYIDSDGTRTSGNLFSVGSGCYFAYGILDSGYKWNLTDKEAQDLARRSIFGATCRDAYSGGRVRVFHIKPKGFEKISDDDAAVLYYQYLS